MQRYHLCITNIYNLVYINAQSIKKVRQKRSSKEKCALYFEAEGLVQEEKTDILSYKNTNKCGTPSEPYYLSQFWIILSRCVSHFHFKNSKTHKRLVNLTPLLALVTVHRDTRFTITEYVCFTYGPLPEPVQPHIC
jgi:hypothetical protein